MAVETAIAVPILLTLLFGVFEFGRLIMFRHLVAHAAREGARVAIVSTGRLTTEDIRSRVRAASAGQLDGATIDVYKADDHGSEDGTWNEAEYGESIAVEIAASYLPMLPTLGILPDSLLVRAKSVMRSEAD